MDKRMLIITVGFRFVFFLPSGSPGAAVLLRVHVPVPVRPQEVAFILLPRLAEMGPGGAASFTIPAHGPMFRRTQDVPGVLDGVICDSALGAVPLPHAGFMAAGVRFVGVSEIPCPRTGYDRHGYVPGGLPIKCVLHHCWPSFLLSSHGHRITSSCRTGSGGPETVSR